MQRICRAGMVLGVALLLAGCGKDAVTTAGGSKDDKEAEGAVETWDGARADLAEGRRPKEAVYHFVNGSSGTITYDLAGNITGVAAEGEDDDWPEAFTRVLDADGALHRYDLDVFDGEMKKRYYRYSGGRLAEDYKVKNPLFSESGALLEGSYDSYSDDYEVSKYIYTYDSQDRLIKEQWGHYDAEGKLKSTDLSEIVYTYEKDLSLAFTSFNGPRRFKRQYDANGNMVSLRLFKGEDMKLERLREWQYDEDGKLLQHKCTEGHQGWADTGRYYYETYDITQYNDSEDIVEESTKISINGKEYTVKKREYVYDEKGRIVEVNMYELLIGKGWDEEQAEWCNSGGNTELYITAKWEYQYSGNNTVKGKCTQYRYEANKDYTKVNLIATNEDEWQGSQESQESETAYWTITYYTEEEIEQYLHDQEFSPVNW